MNFWFEMRLIMKKSYFYYIAILLVFAFQSKSFCQNVSNDSSPILEELQSQKQLTLTSLNILDNQANRIGNDLAKAAAKAEIADAVWQLDNDFAKKILLEAYKLSLPNGEEKEKLKNRTVETAPVEPTQNDIDRMKVRSRILQVARRDSTFIKELVKISAKELGEVEKAETLNSFSVKALRAGDTSQAKDFINQAIQIDPTQQIGWSILQLAAENRELADEAILQYIQTLRNFPLSTESFFRAYSSLQMAVFPLPVYDVGRNRQISPPNPNVTKTFIQFVLEKMTTFEKNQSGSMRQYRPVLNQLWFPVNQFAPELRNNWMWLEQITRRNGDSPIDSTPQSSQEKARKDYEERIKKALESKENKELVQAVRDAVYYDDYKTARNVLSEIEDETLRNKYEEYINANEAMWQAKKGEIIEAQRLAGKLGETKNIAKVYPIVIEQCVKFKDEPCALSLSNQAIKILKSDEKTNIPPYFFSALAKSVYKLDDVSMFPILDSMVALLNKQEDNESVRIGFEADIFKLLAEKNEQRTLQLAESLIQKLPRITALATFYKWKADKLSKEIETIQQKEKTSKTSSKKS